MFPLEPQNSFEHEYSNLVGKSWSQVSTLNHFLVSKPDLRKPGGLSFQCFGIHLQLCLDTHFFSEFWINSYSCYPIILLRSTSLRRRKKNMIQSGITTRMLLRIVMHIPVQLKLLLCRRLVKIFMPPTNLTLLKRFVILHVSFVFFYQDAVTEGRYLFQVVGLSFGLRFSKFSGNHEEIRK